MAEVHCLSALRPSGTPASGSALGTRSRGLGDVFVDLGLFEAQDLDEPLIFGFRGFLGGVLGSRGFGF